jgi:hypothetical protein
MRCAGERTNIKTHHHIMALWISFRDEKWCRHGQFVLQYFSSNAFGSFEYTIFGSFEGLEGCHLKIQFSFEGLEGGWLFEGLKGYLNTIFIWMAWRGSFEDTILQKRSQP